MSTRYNVRFLSEDDLKLFSDDACRARCINEYYVGVIAEDGGSAAAFIIYPKDNTVGFVKRGQMSEEFSLFVAKLSRKLMEEVTEELSAWVKEKDTKAIKFIEFLGFERKDQKVGYYQYIWQIQQQ